MNKVLHILLLLAIGAELTTAALLVKGVPHHNVTPVRKMKSKPRKAFLRWDRDEQFARYQDRERFREEMNQTMHQLMRNHNTKTQLANIESEAVRDLEKRFSRTKNRIDRMKDHTVAGINDLIALT